MIRCESRSPPCARQQRGNALILALLALVVTGLAAATALQVRQIEAKRASGLAEATVLEALRNAAQAAVYEHLNAIQQGLLIEKGGTVVTPTSETGELTWSPTVDQLRDMGYLPSEWSATRSTLNDGPYRITFHRIPAGCLPAACDVQGVVILGSPVLDGGRTSAVDGVVIGPILTRAGADGGVSLPTAPATISGFHGTWIAPNPLPGTPIGVVALRFGTQTGGFSQFVRVGDLRDPLLRGNLSANGALTVSGGARIGGDSAIEGEVRIGPESAPCLTLEISGTLNVQCAGRILARAGLFQDDLGNRSDAGPSGFSTTGNLVASSGLQTASGSIFEQADPSAIRSRSDELYFRGNSGTLATMRPDGLSIPNAISSAAMHLTGIAVEGSPCSNSINATEGTGLGATMDHSLAICINGRWVVAFKFSRAGTQCGSNGAEATDIDDRQSLTCRQGIFVRTSTLLSSFSLVNTLALNMIGGAVRVEKPNCNPSGSVAADALIILSPNNEDVPAVGGSVISGINRYAIDEGPSWLVVLERSADRGAMGGSLIAQIYCHYP